MSRSADRIAAKYQKPSPADSATPSKGGISSAGGTAIGAVVGAMAGGPVGMAIGAAVGFVVGVNNETAAAEPPQKVK